VPGGIKATLEPLTQDLAPGPLIPGPGLAAQDSPGGLERRTARRLTATGECFFTTAPGVPGHCYICGFGLRAGRSSVILAGLGLFDFTI
jgi:hypothetical protein